MTNIDYLYEAAMPEEVKEQFDQLTTALAHLEREPPDSPSPEVVKAVQVAYRKLID